MHEKTFIPILAVALIAVSCTHGVSHIQTRPLPTPNPTSYSFPLPMEEVRSRALQAFSIEHQVDTPVFHRPSDTAAFEYIFSAESSSHAVFGEAIFRDPANAHDIYLHTFGSPFTTSCVYYGRAGGLPFIATFHLHLTAKGPDTLVTVIASDTKVVNGSKFGFGPCGPGQGRICEVVRPTTVEEYSILHYLGHYLGVTNMPDVILPAQ